MPLLSSELGGTSATAGGLAVILPERNICLKDQTKNQTNTKNHQQKQKPKKKKAQKGKRIQ